MTVYRLHTNWNVYVVENFKAKKMKFFEVLTCQVSVPSTSTLTPVYSIRNLEYLANYALEICRTCICMQTVLWGSLMSTALEKLLTHSVMTQSHDCLFIPIPEETTITWVFQIIYNLWLIHQQWWEIICSILKISNIHLMGKKRMSQACGCFLCVYWCL